MCKHQWLLHDVGRIFYFFTCQRCAAWCYIGKERFHSTTDY